MKHKHHKRLNEQDEDNVKHWDLYWFSVMLASGTLWLVFLFLAFG